MFCPNCGRAVEENVAFCPECGAKTGVTQAAPVEPVSRSYTGSEGTTPTNFGEMFTKVANNKNIRIVIAAVALLCVLFLDFISIMGFFEFSGLDLIGYVFELFDTVGGSGSSEVPVMAIIGLLGALIGLFVFVIAAVLLLIGSAINNKTFEKVSSMIGIISGIVLIIGWSLLMSEFKDASMAGGMSAAMGANLAASMLSPFKVLSTGFWGTMVLYVASLVLNHRRTDA